MTKRTEAKRRIRSARRARPGLRFLLTLLLLALLVLLVAFVLGLRPGGERDLAGDGGRRIEAGASGRRPARARRAAERGPGEDERPFRLARWKPEPGAEEVGAESDEPSGSILEGGFLRGPCWLRFRLPLGFDLERTKILVEAVHADLPGLAGRRVLRALRKHEPDEVALLLDAVPGGVWIELRHEGVCELHGPFATTPFELSELAAFEHPLDGPTLPDESDGLFVGPPPRPIAGRERPCVPEGKPDRGSGPITRPLAEAVATGPELRGPWAIRRTTPREDLSGPTTTILHVAPGGLLIRRPQDAEFCHVRRVESDRLEVSWNLSGDDVHYALPGGVRGRYDPNAIVGMSEEFALIGGAHGHLSLPRELADRLRPLAEDEDLRDHRPEAQALGEDLLLFDLSGCPGDPTASGRILVPLMRGSYSMIDLAGSTAGALMAVAVLEIEKDEVLRFELAKPLAERSLRVQVVAAEDDEPIAAAAVFVAGSRLEPPAWLPPAALSDEQGMVEVRGLPDRELVVMAKAPGFEAASWRGPPSAAGGEIIRIALSRAPGLLVRCRDEAGNPVRPPRVAALGRGGELALATVDAEGLARFPGLSPDRYAILACIGEGLEQQVSDHWETLAGVWGATLVAHPRPGDEPIELELPPLRPVRLEVEARGAAAPARFELLVEPIEKPLAPGLWLRIDEREIGAGTLAIDGLPSGRYRATALAGLVSAITDFEVPDRADAPIPLALEFD